MSRVSISKKAARVLEDFHANGRPRTLDLDAAVAELRNALKPQPRKSSSVCQWCGRGILSEPCGPSHKMRKRLAEAKKRKKTRATLRKWESLDREPLTTGVLAVPALPFPKPGGDREKALRKESKRERRASIRADVFKRSWFSDGDPTDDYQRCEGPALHDPVLGVLGGRCAAQATDLSHLFGKGKGRLPESVRTCAAWCRDCHKAFGANRPSAKAWWTFIAWWLRSQGFLLEAAEAEKRAVFVEVRAALPSSPRTTRKDTNG